MGGRICAKAVYVTNRMGMSCKQANELLNRLIPKYEDRISEAPIGLTISECYNLEWVEPTHE